MPLIATTRLPIHIARHTDAPGAPPLLLIHGAGGSRLHWPGALRQLPHADTIALDLPGHGSSPPPGRDSIAAYADDVVALLDALALPGAVWVGHSMGGAIALWAALEHPARVRGLVLVGTGAKLGVRPDLLVTACADPEVAAAQLARAAYQGGSAPASPEAGAPSGAAASIAAGALCADLRACQAFDLRDRLADVRAPALVLGGTADVLAPPKWSQFLAERLPRATLVMVAGAGHMLALQQPGYVASTVAQWWQQHILPGNTPPEG